MLVAQLCPTLCDPVDYSPPASSLRGILQARIPRWVTLSFPGHLPNPGIEPRSPALQIDGLPPELLGKPRALLYSYFLELLQFHFVLFWLLSFSCSLVPVSVWFLVLAVPFPSCLPRAALYLVSVKQQQSLEPLASLYGPRGSLGGPRVVLFWLWTSRCA